MSYLWTLLTSVVRIVFLRGSPERIYYTRRLFIVSLLLAVIASAAVQHIVHQDHLVFVILRVFAELVPFMLMMVLLTSKIARFRLARMMLAMVLISLLADTFLLSVGWLALGELKLVLVYAVAGCAFYGATNSLKWGLNSTYLRAARDMALYVMAVIGLDMAFSTLYSIMAA